MAYIECSPLCHESYTVVTVIEMDGMSSVTSKYSLYQEQSISLSAYYIQSESLYFMAYIWAEELPRRL